MMKKMRRYGLLYVTSTWAWKPMAYKAKAHRMALTINQAVQTSSDCDNDTAGEIEAAFRKRTARRGNGSACPTP